MGITNYVHTKLIDGATSPDRQPTQPMKWTLDDLLILCDCGAEVGSQCQCWKPFDISVICPSCIHDDLDANQNVQQDNVKHQAHLDAAQLITDRHQAVYDLKISGGAKPDVDRTVGERKVCAGLVPPDVTDAELGVS